MIAFIVLVCVFLILVLFRLQRLDRVPDRVPKIQNRAHTALAFVAAHNIGLQFARAPHDVNQRGAIGVGCE